MSATVDAIGAGPEPVASGHALLRGVQRLISLADSASSAEQVLRTLACELESAVGADEVHFHHLSGFGMRRELVVVYLGGDGRLSYHSAEAERPPAVSWVASTGRAFLAGGERELLAGLPGLASGPVAARCALLLPMQMSGRTHAVVVLVGRDPARLGERSVERASVLVDQAATVLALLRARAEAGTDAVTGCMNHRAMRRRLAEELARAERAHGRLSCLLIDLDDFKLVNDRHGHPIGDELLRGVAETLMHEFRSFDRVARYGGDEFVVILAEADLENAVVAGERALERLGGIVVGRATPSPGSPELDPGLLAAREVEPLVRGVGASIGVAQWQTGMSVDALLAACDAALLRGKREGKHRVTATR
jgi:GGDEF domain-containing protein